MRVLLVSRSGCRVVLVGAALPGPVGIREEHSVGEEMGHLVVAGHLRCLILGEAVAGTPREISHGLGQGTSQLVGAPTLGEMNEPDEAAPTPHQSADARAIVAAGDGRPP